MSKKVIGIISYFPNKDTDYNTYVFNQRTAICSAMLKTVCFLWHDIDIIIIAQNWQDYKIPDLDYSVTIYDYPKLGILQARRKLREIFLESDYDYLIMLDDDTEILCPDAKAYLQEIDDHPDGFGVIRHRNHPLILSAISKHIYSQIDLPDIDLEKYEGFGSDIFVAQCFHRFPDKCFNFSPSVIKDNYSKYSMIPSTRYVGAHINTFMSDITDAIIRGIDNIKPEVPAPEYPIDVVIPYVDSTDPIWQETYIDAGMEFVSATRFRSWGTLRYLFRGIATYMPFIHKIHLLVSGKSQVPDWLNTELVHVVCHSDFIPENYLPVYNSCTIECFLGNIPDLAEHFIYFNDDIFPINTMSASDFFYNDLPCLSFIEHVSAMRMIYCLQCRSGIDMITKMLNVEEYPKDEILSPEHSAIPMLRSTLKKVSAECNSAIKFSITKLRSVKNVNQYIYSYYHFFTNTYTPGVCSNMYIEVTSDLNPVKLTLNNKYIKLMCLNDCGGVGDYELTQAQIVDLFKKKYPDLCQYELF